MKREITLHPYNDLVFKYLFGRNSSKRQLMSFINAVLAQCDHEPVIELEIENPFSIQDSQDDKLSILDLKGKDSFGRSFNIEVQTVDHKDFHNRSLYSWAKTYSSQIERGEDYDLLRPVISINLLNFNLIEGSDKYHNQFSLQEKDKSEIQMGDHLLINFLEMPKFIKTMKDEVLNKLDDWMLYFIHEGKEDNVVQEVMDRNPDIKKTHHEYLKFLSDKQLRNKALSMELARMDHIARIRMAEQKGLKRGLEKGIIQGLEQGKERGREEIARKLKDLNIPIDIICNSTGLSKEQVEAL